MPRPLADRVDRIESLLLSGRSREARSLAKSMEGTHERNDFDQLCRATVLFALHGEDATDLLDAAHSLADDYEGTERRIETRWVNEVRTDVNKFLSGNRKAAALPLHMRRSRYLVGQWGDSPTESERRHYVIPHSDFTSREQAYCTFGRLDIRETYEVKPYVPFPRIERIFPRVQIELAEISDAFLRMLIEDPARLHSLPPRRFEEVVAELFARDGWSVQLGPRSADHGIDVWAIKKEPVGNLLCIAQCKRYTPQNRVGVGVVRDLYGMQQLTGANLGMIATTSYFSRFAENLQRDIGWSMSLKDMDELLVWIARVTTGTKA